jgi:hypothetical protein
MRQVLSEPVKQPYRASWHPSGGLSGAKEVVFAIAASLSGGVHATMRRQEEEPMRGQAMFRSVVVMAAISLAASNVIGAERTVVVEHFTATW